MATGRGRRIAALITVNTLLLTAGIIALELAFGNWVRDDRLDRLNIIRGRTLHFRLDDLYPAEYRTTAYTRDPFGLRGSHASPGEITVLTVGGSTTDQRYITDGQTWQDVLERNGRAAGKKAVVANAGLDGQSTHGHIKNFDWWFPNVPGLKPRIVVFYVGVNDFYNDGSTIHDRLVQDRVKPAWRIIAENPAVAGHLVCALLSENSALFRLGRTLHGLYLARVRHDLGHGMNAKPVPFDAVPWTPAPLLNAYDGIMHRPLAAYRDRLTLLIARTQEFGATPVFVTQPTRRYKFRDGRLLGSPEMIDYGGTAVNGVDYYRMMRILDGVTCSTAAAHGARCIDMARERIWEDDDFYDPWHMTPKGAKKVGDYLYREMKDIL